MLYVPFAFLDAVQLCFQFVLLISMEPLLPLILFVKCFGWVAFADIHPEGSVLFRPFFHLLSDCPFHVFFYWEVGQSISFRFVDPFWSRSSSSFSAALCSVPACFLIASFSFFLSPGFADVVGEVLAWALIVLVAPLVAPCTS